MGSCFFLSSDCSPTYFWGFFLASESNAYKIRGKEGKRDRFLFVRDKSESGWMSGIVQTSTFSLLNKLFCYFIDPAFGCVKREKCFLKTGCSMILSFLLEAENYASFNVFRGFAWGAFSFPASQDGSSFLALPLCNGIAQASVFNLLLLPYVIFLACQTHSTLAFWPLLGGWWLPHYSFTKIYSWNLKLLTEHIHLNVPQAHVHVKPLIFLPYYSFPYVSHFRKYGRIIYPSPKPETYEYTLCLTPCFQDMTKSCWV